MKLPTVALVGGGGHVGRLIGPVVARTRKVVVVDRAEISDAPWAEEARIADVSSIASMRESIRGADQLVFLAMGTKDNWGSPEWSHSQFDVNVRGLFNTLEACAAEGVGQIVIAGSMSVFEDFFSTTKDTVPDATEAYGLSKRLGEQVAEAASRRHTLQITVLRLTFPADQKMWDKAGSDRDSTVMTSGDDTARAFVAALDAPGSGYRALPVTGDHAKIHIDWAPTFDAIDWSPLSRRNRA